MGKKNKIGVVYSTNPDYEYTFNEEEDIIDIDNGDQQLKVFIDRKQRKGKSVTIVDGFEGSEESMKSLGKLLKSKCGVGGSVKDGQIIIQGEHKQKIYDLLISNGYNQTKMSGG